MARTTPIRWPIVSVDEGHVSPARSAPFRRATIKCMSTKMPQVSMIEAVYVSSSSATTPARFAATAARYGYDGIVLLSSDYDWEAGYLSAIEERYHIDIAVGTQVASGNRDTSSQAIIQARPHVEVLSARADYDSLARFFAEQERVDVLAYPVGGESGLSHTIAKLAKRHGVYVKIDLAPILRWRGGHRVTAIDELRSLVKVVTYYDVPYVVSASPHSHFALRSPRELQAVGETIGLSDEKITRGLVGWAEIVARSREARDDRFIEPGVRIDAHEANDR